MGGLAENLSSRFNSTSSVPCSKVRFIFGSCGKYRVAQTGYGRWSLKEAAYKAMFPYVHPTWKEFTYRRFDAERHRKPKLEYRPLKATQGGVGRIHCSVSHDGEYVYTSVLVEETECHNKPS